MLAHTSDTGRRARVADERLTLRGVPAPPHATQEDRGIVEHHHALSNFLAVARDDHGREGVARTRAEPWRTTA